MSVSGILTVLAQLLFVLVSAVAIIDYIGRPHPRRRDFVLLCCALGIPLGLTLLKNYVAIEPRYLDLLAELIFLAHPYLLVRLLHDFRPTPPGLHRAVLGGMILSWVVLFFFEEPFPRITQAVLFGYCLIVDGYCMLSYLRGAQASQGPLQRRLTHMTVGAGLITLAVAGIVANAFTIQDGVTSFGDERLLRIALENLIGNAKST